MLYKIFTITRLARQFTLIMLTVTTFIGMLEVLILATTASVITKFLTGSNPGYLPKILHLTPIQSGLVIMLLYFLMTFMTRLNITICQKIGIQYYNELFEAYASLEYNDIQTINIGHIQKRIVTDGDRVTGGVIYPFSQVLQKTVTVVALSLSILSAVSVSSLIPFMFLFAVYIITSQILKSKQQKSGQKLTETLSARFTLIGNKFNLFRESKAYRVRNFLRADFEENSNILGQNTRDVIFYADLPRFVIEACVYVVIVLAAYKQDYVLNNRDEVAVVLLGTMRILPNLQALFSNYAFLRSHISAIDEKAFQAKNIDPTEVLLSEHLISHFQLSNFSPSVEGTPLIAPVSYSFSLGDFVGIFGESGIGKTQFLHCLSGISHSYFGKSYVQAEHTSGYVRCASYFSNGIPIEGTVFDNIIVFAEDISEQDVIELVVKYDLFPEVEAKEFENMLGWPLESLSLGQKQRILLMRTVLADATLYIFDEPTSALNANLASTVLHFMKNELHDKAVVIASHDNACMKFVNKKIIIQRNQSCVD